MSWIILTLSIVYQLATPPVAVHEFHISRTEVQYKSDQKAIQISTNIFIDDFELALAGNGYTDTSLFMNDEAELADQAISEYVNEQLIIQIDDQQLSLNFIGKEMSEDLSAAWCYFEVTDVAAFQDLMLKNNILNREFDDQKNITVVKIDGQRKAHWIFDNEYIMDQYQNK
jgi:hypothetical protein